MDYSIMHVKSRLFQPFAIFCCLAITMRPLVDASKIKGKGTCATKVMCKCTKQGNKCC